MSTVDALELTRRIRADHDVVEAVVGALLRWAREGQEEAPFDRAEFVEFFRSWVGTGITASKTSCFRSSSNGSTCRRIGDR